MVMTKTFRFLIFSTFLLILPINATPPEMYAGPRSLSCSTVSGETVLVKKYLLSEPFSTRDGDKTGVRIYYITVVTLLNRAPVRRQLPKDQFDIRQ